MSARVASRRGERRRRRSRGVAATHEAYRSRRPRSHLPARPKSAPLAALAALFSPKSQRLESHGITRNHMQLPAFASKVCPPKDSLEVSRGGCQLGSAHMDAQPLAPRW
jgi:hypothetical protein